MSIPPPNYTQIPNVILDEWMLLLKPAELKVILLICRKTFGFHKDKDSLSYSQMQKLTGMKSRSRLIKVLNSLNEKGLVVKKQKITKKGDSDCNIYCLNVKRWCPTGHQGGVLQDTRVVSYRTPTKENYTKENYTKEDIPPKVLKDASKEVHEISFSLSEGEFQNISSKDLEVWGKLYPSVKIDRELLAMCEWLKANEKKAKLKKKWRQFITTWLRSTEEKEVNRQAYKAARQATGKSSEPEIQQNKERAARLERFVAQNSHTFERKDVRVEALNKHVEFGYSGGSSYVVCIPYHEHGFNDRLDSACYKFKIPMRKTA